MVLNLARLPDEGILEAAEEGIRVLVSQQLVLSERFARPARGDYFPVYTFPLRDISSLLGLGDSVERLSVMPLELDSWLDSWDVTFLFERALRAIVEVSQVETQWQVRAGRLGAPVLQRSEIVALIQKRARQVTAAVPGLPLELRVLRIPALNLEAVWLFSHYGGWLIPIGSFPSARVCRMTPGRPYAFRDFVGHVRKRAEKVPTHETDMPVFG